MPARARTTALFTLLCSSACGSSVWAQTPTVSVALTPPQSLLTSPAVSMDRRIVEALTFYAAIGLYGARTGAMINETFGLRLNRDPVEWFVLPTLLAGAGVALAWAVDHPTHIRRGRGFSMAAGLTLGQLSVSALGYFRGAHRRPQGDAFSSPLLWLGATLGLTTGMLVGELFDPTAGSATFVVAFGIGGVLSGAAVCGMVGCRHDLGLYMFGGEVALTAGAMAAVALVHPTESEVRWAIVGALGGSIPGALVLGLGATDALDFEGQNTVGFALSMGGLLGGGITALALARALGNRGPTTRSAAATRGWVIPTLSAGPGSLMLGLSLPPIL